MSGVSASPPPTFCSFERRPKTRSFCCHQSLPQPKLRISSHGIGFRGGRLQRDRVIHCNCSANPPPPASGTDFPLFFFFFFVDLGVEVPFLMEFAVLCSGSLSPETLILVLYVYTFSRIIKLHRPFFIWFHGDSDAQILFLFLFGAY